MLLVAQVVDSSPVVYRAPNLLCRWDEPGKPGLDPMKCEHQGKLRLTVFAVGHTFLCIVLEARTTFQNTERGW